MNVREHLLALNDELRRRKSVGERTILVRAESLEGLRTALAKARSEVPRGEWGGEEPTPATPAAVAEPAAPAPMPVRQTVKVSTPPSALLPNPPQVQLAAGDKRTRWTALRELVLSDPICQAHVRPGKNVVLGVGNLEAKLFFCGEAPGADEEVQGEPFVGPAGQLLTRMIQAMGLKREEVYIGNIMNWRPEMPVGAGGVQIGNRPPTAEELGYCLPYLKAQLEIVQPQVVVALGATAAAGLLGADTFRTLGEIRGKWHTFAGLPVMVTYHPSYILRNQSNRSKRMIWEDLLKVMERALLPISERQRKYFLQ